MAMQRPIVAIHMSVRVRPTNCFSVSSCLPETDEYIEIKGYKTIKDEAKWSQFPSHRKLRVLMKKELLELGVEIKT